MDNNFIDLVKDAFNNWDRVSPEEILALIQKTDLFFASLEQTIYAEDKGLQEEAMRNALELKSFVESQSSKVFSDSNNT